MSRIGSFLSRLLIDAAYGAPESYTAYDYRGLSRPLKTVLAHLMYLVVRTIAHRLRIAMSLLLCAGRRCAYVLL
jgi:hypothetical protein